MIEGLTPPSEVVPWIEADEVRLLNVAGNRKRNAPGIGERVERFLSTLFDRLGRVGGASS